MLSKVGESCKEIQFICDSCSKKLNTEIDRFIAAVSLAKAQGWHARKVNGLWLNFCSKECLDKEYN